MSENGSLVFKSTNAVSRTFSKTPLIRKFESLLSDEEFESAGLKITRHPLSDTCLIVPASKYLFGDDDNNSNKLSTSHSTFLHSFNFPAAEDRSLDKTTAPKFRSIIQRLDDLRAIATEDKLTFSEDSAMEALEWLRDATPPATPSVFLLNNGNVRLLWKSDGTQIGVQFLGDGTAQFVFLGKDDQRERIFGSLKVSELLKRFRGLDLLDALGF